MRSKDLTGQKFGRLTVLGLDPEPYRSPGGKPTRRWKCRCDCGAELVVLQNALTSKKNGTRSCGCARAEKARSGGVDMTGQRVGRLVVLREVELDKPEQNGTRRGWLCRCDCGKEIVATRKDFLTGLQSCGCLLSDTARKKIVEDNVVGHYDGTTVSAIKPGRKLNRNNKSGVRGVYWSSRENCWIAKIELRKKQIMLGRFHNFEDACKARTKAEKELFAPVIEEFEARQPPD